MWNRRAFLKSGGLALLGIGLGGIPSFIAQVAKGANLKLPNYGKRKVLVFIFQRGAMDGLMAVTPFTDPFLKQARPALFMSPSNTEAAPLLDLDGRFGLHPSFQELGKLFQNEQLAIVHGMGSPNNSRSHFDAQDYMESGTPFNKGTSSGWLNRAVGLIHDHQTPFSAVSLTSALPRSLYGSNEAIAISNLTDFALQIHGSDTKTMQQDFEALYNNTSSKMLNSAGKESFAAMSMLKPEELKKYRPENGSVYPSTSLGNSLKQIAQLIKMDVGLEVAFTESLGWDTHFNQGTTQGVFARSAADLSKSINAFWQDLGSYQENTVLMTSTEFGRTMHENGTGGTDHGRASCCFILGSQVDGGRVYGSVPDLSIENLADGRDLPVTTDFRTVFSSVADRHLGLNNDAVLFPEWEKEKLSLFRG
ncbi:MAG: DUF1501 domain-containing protein [Bacteroidetes bacterium]|nr:DUF1501 domain-containing protein [Bacteroidota bacterium]